MKSVIFIAIIVLFSANLTFAQDSGDFNLSDSDLTNDIHTSKALIDDRKTVKAIQVSNLKVEKIVFNLKMLIQNRSRSVAFNNTLSSYKPLEFGLGKNFNLKYGTNGKLKDDKEKVIEQLFNEN
ncbi:hypothetical protein [Winogradskyella sp. PE311]|uniref:hypothetical protein n=1 Tax=Winogradskyella sp. PE311 TaxID=3366943 RepID=UPI0039803359